MASRWIRKFGHFPDIKNNQEFRTEDGRAEILLTPGVFLRLGEDSGIRMLSNSLDDTRVEVTSGAAMVEVDQIPKDNAITLVYKDTNITLLKHGLYRVDSSTARLRVYDGEATVASGSGKLTLRSNKQTFLDGTLLAENFDKNAGDDELYRWADRRAGYVVSSQRFICFRAERWQLWIRVWVRIWRVRAGIRPRVRSRLRSRIRRIGYRDRRLAIQSAIRHVLLGSDGRNGLQSVWIWAFQPRDGVQRSGLLPLLVRPPLAGRSSV